MMCRRFFILLFAALALISMTANAQTDCYRSGAGTWNTSTSAITGSPSVNIADGTTYYGFTFAPASGSVTLGTWTVGNVELTALKSHINGAITLSTDQIAWPDSYDVPDTAQTNNSGVTGVTNTSVGFDTVTLTVPLASDTKKFARLTVTLAP